MREGVRWSDACLQEALQSLDLGPVELARALRYPLEAGGKRLRPSLVRLFGRALGAQDSELQGPAAAIEFVHTYSLVHDDLPCMDDDDLRRGVPTTHSVFGEAVGVLVGDGLLTLAFELLAQSGGPRALEMVGVLARAAGPSGMVGGQVLDLAAEGQITDLEGVRRIHRLKTAALIEAACELGAIAAGADDGCRTAVRRYGLALGLCFQAIDDCLDVTGDSADLGKTPGKDAAADKATLVQGLGLEGARTEAEAWAEEAREAARQLGLGPDHMALQLVDWLLARRS